MVLVEAGEQEYWRLAVLGGTGRGLAPGQAAGVIPPTPLPAKDLGKDSSSMASMSRSWANRCQCGRHGHAGETPERTGKFER